MTTYPTSTAPAAKAWLFAQMQAGLTTDPSATFGLTYATDEDTVNSPDDQVWMGPVANRIASPFAMVGNEGANSMQEEYDLTVQITCWRAGDNGDIAEARAWLLAGAVETFARTDPTMGGNVITSRPGMSGSTVDWDDAGNGRIASLTLTIHCFAVL